MPNVRNRDAEAFDERVMAPDAGRRLTAEAVGTALLLAAVVGSGIMANRLAAGNEAIALLANTIATGAALVALIPLSAQSRASTSIPLSRMRMHRKAVSPGGRCQATSARRPVVPCLVCGLPT